LPGNATSSDQPVEYRTESIKTDVRSGYSLLIDEYVDANLAEQADCDAGGITTGPAARCSSDFCR
jgi:hypothetical protein